MKKNLLSAWTLAVALFCTASCDNTDYSNRSPFDNVAYINVASTSPVEKVTFKKTLSEQQRSFAAQLANVVEEADVTVMCEIDPSLIAAYNTKNGTSLTMLESSHYRLDHKEMVVEAGKSLSQPNTIYFEGLDELDIDVTYLCPVTLTSASHVSLLEGSKTVYYLVRRSSAITTAANLKDSYLEAAGFLDESKNSILKGLPALTLEALIYVDDFTYSGPNHSSGASIISTIMGVEQYFLFRIGDDGFPRAQLQIHGPHPDYNQSKFPPADKSKELKTKEWYHVAVVYDVEAHTLSMYVNGKLQSYQENYAPSVMTVDICGTANTEFQIGRSYEDELRQLNGNISEARVWGVARTEAEIWQSMYDVDPQTPGLLAYWKFNEGSGDEIKDQTGHGFDAVAQIDVWGTPLKWPSGIEIPQLNKED
jgi:hypothetical protein